MQHIVQELQEQTAHSQRLEDDEHEWNMLKARISS